MRNLTSAACAALAIGVAGTARAGDQVSAATQSVMACVKPRAAVALSDPAEPRAADPRWISYVVSDGQCTRLGPGQPLRILGFAGGLTQVVLANQTAAQVALYVPSSLIGRQHSADPPPLDRRPVAPLPAIAVSGTSAAPPDPWQLIPHGAGSMPVCEIAGPAGPGTMQLSVDANSPGLARLTLTKSSWQIPSGTVIHSKATFSDGVTIELLGTGDRSAVTFEFRGGALRPWVHEFTAASSGAIAFGGNEPPWQIDLRGTSVAITAMAECVKAGALDVPPPFDRAATQPFASRAVEPTASPTAPAPQVPAGSLDDAPPAVGSSRNPTTDSGGAAAPKTAFDADVTRLSSCFAEHYSPGEFKSNDGGQSSIRLLMNCLPQWDKAADQCVLDTGKPKEQCNLSTGMLSQAYILLRESGSPK